MININLESIDSRLNFRDPVSFYFAKWFDEQFTVDILNCTGIKAQLADAIQDKHHIDYTFIIDGIVHTADSKLHMHNFRFDSNTSVKKCEDIISIGNYALYNSTVEYYSFIWNSSLYIIQRMKFASVTPIKVRNNSRGQNGSYQSLYQYNIRDLINIADYVFKISDSKYKCYDDAYKIYCKYRYINEGFREGCVSKDSSVCLSEYHALEDMRSELLEVIKRYNEIYNELPRIDTVSTLDSVMKLIDF